MLFYFESLDAYTILVICWKYRNFKVRRIAYFFKLSNFRTFKGYLKTKRVNDFLCLKKITKIIPTITSASNTVRKMDR